MRRAQIASTDVKMHNSQISKELGAEWREMSLEEKAPYVKRVCASSSYHLFHLIFEKIENKLKIISFHFF